MIEEYITRKAAIAAIGEEPEVWDEEKDEYSLGQKNQWLYDKHGLEAVPAAKTIYGYRIEHLATIARVIEKNDISPNSLSSLFEKVSDTLDLVVSTFIKEREEIAKKAMEEWENGNL